MKLLFAVRDIATIYLQAYVNYILKSTHAATGNRPVNIVTEKQAFSDVATTAQYPK